MPAMDLCLLLPSQVQGTIHVRCKRCNSSSSLPARAVPVSSAFTTSGGARQNSSSKWRKQPVRVCRRQQGNQFHALKWREGQGARQQGPRQCRKGEKQRKAMMSMWLQPMGARKYIMLKVIMISKVAPQQVKSSERAFYPLAEGLAQLSLPHHIWSLCKQSSGWSTLHHNASTQPCIVKLSNAVACPQCRYAHNWLFVADSHAHSCICLCHLCSNAVNIRLMKPVTAAVQHNATPPCVGSVHAEAAFISLQLSTLCSCTWSLTCAGLLLYLPTMQS